MQKSIKQLQSEAGVTGESSIDNIMLIDRIDDELMNDFEHNHDNVTKNDAVILLSQMHLGLNVKGDTGVMNTKIVMKGCYHNLVDLLTHSFKQDVELRAICAEALMKSFR